MFNFPQLREGQVTNMQQKAARIAETYIATLKNGGLPKVLKGNVLQYMNGIGIPAHQVEEAIDYLIKTKRLIDIGNKLMLNPRKR